MTDALAVDLAALKKLANVYLQDLANDYNDLNHKVAGTAQDDGPAFLIYPAFAADPGTSGLDSVYPTWSALRDKLCDYLGHTSDNYQAAVTAMHHIVKVFAEADHVSAREIDAVYRHDLKVAARAGDKPVEREHRDVIIR